MVADESGMAQCGDDVVGRGTDHKISVHQVSVRVMGAMIAMSLRRSGADDETRIHGGVMEYFVWMTARKIRAGALDDFEGVWRLNPYLRAWLVPTPTGRGFGEEIIGVSFWDSKESCEPGGAQRPRKGAAKQWRRTCSIPRGVLPRSRTGHSWPEEVALLAGLTSCKAQANDIFRHWNVLSSAECTNCPGMRRPRVGLLVHNRLP